jgi:hypothetical protein
MREVRTRDLGGIPLSHEKRPTPGLTQPVPVSQPNQQYRKVCYVRLRMRGVR